MSDKIRQTFKDVTTKQSDDDRTLVVTISTKNEDRSKDVVYPDGADLTNYLKNPVVALNHNYQGLPIAKTEQIEIKEDRIMARVKFPKPGIHALSDTVYELYKDGFLNAWSIGFIPKEYEPNEQGGNDFTKWELLEYSAVLVPDNPEALTMLRSKGYDLDDKGKIKRVTIKVDKKVDDELKAKEEAIMAKDNEQAEPVQDVPYVVDTKTRSLIADTIVDLKKLTDNLEKLVLAEKSTPEAETNLKVIDLVQALKLADKTIGVALRNHKARVADELGN